MDWQFTWAVVASYAAAIFFALWRLERRRAQRERKRAERWLAELQGEELRREPPFLAPAAGRIEAGQLVAVRTDGMVVAMKDTREVDRVVGGIQGGE